MALITLAEIRAALKTQLSTLLTTATVPGPFVSVTSYAGRADRVDLEQQTDSPSVVIAFDREIFQQKQGTIRTLRGTRQTAGELRWAVFVVVRAETSPEAVADDTATNSLDNCIDAVLGALIGFHISGLVDRGEVELVERAPEGKLNGVFAERITIRTPRPLVVTPADTSDYPFVVLDGNLNIPDAPNPRVTFEADPEDT